MKLDGLESEFLFIYFLLKVFVNFLLLWRDSRYEVG